MERYKIDYNYSNITDTFIVNIICPLSITEIDKGQYSILFLAGQDCTDEKIYLQMIIKANDISDIKYLDSCSINSNIISNNTNALKIYREITSDLSMSSLFITDFDMIIDEDHKRYICHNSIKIIFY